MIQRSNTLPAVLLQSSADAWGDEREHGVMLEAYAYVFILSTIVLWTIAAVAAWFVPPWVTVLLFFGLLIPSIEWQRYARARGVDANALAYGGDSWIRVALTGVYFGACALSMASAVISQLDPDGGISGAIAGGAVGAIVAVAVSRWAAKRKKKQAAADVADE